MPNYDDSLPLPPTPAADAPHLYVINSNPEFLELMHDVLADVRLRVTLEQLRPNVAVTLNNIRSAQPDLILLDYIPFKSDAGRLLEAMAASEDLSEQPIMLASTGMAAAEELAAQYPGLVRDVLPKPFELDELYSKLGRLVKVTAP